LLGPRTRKALTALPDHRLNPPASTNSDSLHKASYGHLEGTRVGSVIKKRRKRMAKKKHRKLLKRTRVQRRNKK
jgi:hypothetical protein